MKLKSIKLLLFSFKLRFSENINYRTSLVSHTIAMISYVYLRVAVVLITGSIGQGIIGWDTYQLILFAGVHQVFVSLIFLLTYRQFYLLIQNIYFGQLEYDLIKPVDSQFAISLKGGNLNNVYGTVFGLIIIIYSLNKLQIIPSLTNIMVFFVFLFLGILIIYSVLFASSCANFYFPRLDNARELGLRLAGDVARFPAQAFQKANTILYFFLLPFTLATTIPAQALLNQINFHWMLGLLFISLIMFYFSRRFWFYSLKHYTSASS